MQGSSVAILCHVLPNPEDRRGQVESHNHKRIEMNQYNLFSEPINLKTEAIKKAVVHQDSKVSGWSLMAYEMLRKYIYQVDDFITEDFRFWAESHGLVKPKESRAYGGIVLRASKSGLIYPTGEFRNMKSPKCHDNPKRVWRRK